MANPPGRPSVFEQRRMQIIDAFLQLVAQRGLEGVGLADVAAVSGVQQTNIRHFVGNRDDLVIASIEELTRRYKRDLEELSSDEPDMTMLMRWYFGSRDEYSTEDAAYFLLASEATRNPKTVHTIEDIWALTLGSLEVGLRRSYPHASTARIRDTAYVLACLAETNGTLQRLGYPRSRAQAAQKAAWLIIDQLKAAE